MFGPCRGLVCGVILLIRLNWISMSTFVWIVRTRAVPELARVDDLTPWAFGIAVREIERHVARPASVATHHLELAIVQVEQPVRVAAPADGVGRVVVDLHRGPVGFPVLSTGMTCSVPSRTNAIHLPSGDQAGPSLPRVVMVANCSPGG